MKDSLFHPVMAVVLLASTLDVAVAYTPKNHVKSVRDAAARLQLERGEAVPQINLILAGVREPDDGAPGAMQMVRQRFAPGGYGKRRDVLPTRIAAQSFHASPNPTRDPYTNSPADLAWQEQATPTAREDLLENRYPLDVYAYDTNEGVRNRILINASQFLCVSYAHRDDAQSARKFGNLLHMIGDSYSASHVQRSTPEGGPDAPCGTEKIEWNFSMDLIAWKLHRPADKTTDDWRFRCLVEHTSDLMKLWVNGRRAVRQETDAAVRLARANEHVGEALGLLCDRVLREDADVLRKPAGGAAAGYSNVSGSDLWRIFKKREADRPIQPRGLTGEAESQAWQQGVDAELRKNGKRFWYPSRELGDLCTQRALPDEMPAALRCSAQEIAWATSGSHEVDTMWIPPRAQP